MAKVWKPSLAERKKRFLLLRTLLSGFCGINTSAICRYELGVKV